jgi:formate dehydrogenase subunit delta
VAEPSETRLATEIAAQFRHQSPEEAAHTIATHIRKFWDPRMRARLMSQVTQAGEACDAHLAAAVDVLKRASH